MCGTSLSRGDRFARVDCRWGGFTRDTVGVVAGGGVPPAAAKVQGGEGMPHPDFQDRPGIIAIQRAGSKLTPSTTVLTCDRCTRSVCCGWAPVGACARAHTCTPAPGWVQEGSAELEWEEKPKPFWRRKAFCGRGRASSPSSSSCSVGAAPKHALPLALGRWWWWAPPLRLPWMPLRRAGAYRSAGAPGEVVVLQPDTSC